MSESHQDIWSQWLLHGRFGGDPELRKKMFEYLYPIRDRVLIHIDLEDGDTLLDVGCGDGLIAFRALEKFENSCVIFSDISQNLLSHVEAIAGEMSLQDRCRFVCSSADDLSALEGETVDAVTTRSVLIYVADKQKSFHEFYRVLKTGGKISLFEPINRFGWPDPPGQFEGYEAAPVEELVRKLMNHYQQFQSLTSDPMMDFDERDLVTQAEKAGFSEIHLDLEIRVAHHEKEDWFAWINTASNPKVPTLAEAMREVFTAAEEERFTAHLRPLVEAGKGKHRGAVAYLWALK